MPHFLLRLGIRQKLLVAFLTVVATVLSISYIAFYTRSQTLLRQEVERSLSATTEIASEHLGARVEVMESAVKQIASRTQLRLALKAWREGEHVDSAKSMQRILSDARNATPQISNIIVFTADRQYVTGVRSDFDAQRIPPSIFDASIAHTGYAGLLEAGTEAQQIAISGSLDLEGQHLGMLFALIDLDSFELFANSPQLQVTGLRLVVSVLDGDQQIRILPTPRGKPQALLFNPFAATSSEKASLHEAIDSRGASVLAVLTTVPRLGWGLTANVDEAVVLAPLREQTNFLLLLAGLCLLISVIVTLLLSGIMTRPIVDMTHVTELIASGDMNLRIEQLSHDELGQLARAVNQMADKLLTMKAELELRVQQKELHLLKLSADLGNANDELTRLAATDALTGIPNRRVFDAALNREWARCRRQQCSLAILLLDVDHFKKLNDKLGHPVGDIALQRIAQVLQQGVQRAGDTVARLGGEEFAALLPDTELPDATSLAESLRIAVMKAAIAHPDSTCASVVTVSIGVAACLPAENMVPTRLLALADKALYQAKMGGRNQIASIDNESPEQAPTNDGGGSSSV